MAKKAKPTCGAVTAHGHRCRHPAGYGTDHPGSGHCMHHGGRSSAPVRLTHALAHEEPVDDGVVRAYDELLKDRDLGELLRQMKKRDPVDLTEDVQLARAVTIDFINRARDLEVALIRWSQSWDKDWIAITRNLTEELIEAHMSEDWERYAAIIAKMPDPMTFLDRPGKTLDVAGSVRMFKDLATIVEKIVQLQNTNTVPVRDVEVLLIEVAGVTERTIRSKIDDPVVRDRLIDALQGAYTTLRVEPWATHGNDPAADQDGRQHRGIDA